MNNKPTKEEKQLDINKLYIPLNQLPSDPRCAMPYVALDYKPIVIKLLPPILSFLEDRKYEVKEYNLGDKIVYQNDKLLALYLIFENPDNIKNVKIIANGNKIVYNSSNLKELTFMNFYKFSPNPMIVIENNKNIGMYSFSLNPESDNPQGYTSAKIELQFEYNNKDKIKIIYQYKD